MLAGPWVGQTLADLETDVIKVESPEATNPQWGPPWIEHDGERSAAYYHAANRGKRSIVADFRDADDLDRVRTWPPGPTCWSRISRPAAWRIRTRLRFAIGGQPGLSLFGDRLWPDRAARTRGGLRLRDTGMSGFMALTGEPDGQPMKVSSPTSPTASIRSSASRRRSR